MKRRNFLKGLLAATGAAATLAPGSEDVTLQAAGASSAVMCAVFDYDGNLVLEGKFAPSLRMVIPVARRVTFAHKPTDRTFEDAIFERVGNGRSRIVRYEQVRGPRMPRRGYVL